MPAQPPIPAVPPCWQAVLFAALAGGMGWGIRGQYGHETGAMIAGLLVGLVLVLGFCPHAASLPAARAVAWCTVAIGFGGSMTYGQTLGLTHDTAMIGNWAALRWGMLGLALKGGVWIGFAGLFLGLGLGGVRYQPRELLLLMLGLLGLFVLGVALLNCPFDPQHRRLPWLYFSDDWRWEPAADLKPRREVWGGLLFALLGAMAYVGGRRQDRLALHLGLWGMLGGAIGFPLGQSLQAFHAWNPALFRLDLLAEVDRYLNWWNWMETIFGAVFGAVLGLGLWLNRRRIASLSDPGQTTLAPSAEWLLAAIHITLCLTSEFLSVPALGLYTEFSLLLGLIPIVGIAGGRWWPYLVILPITLLPIAIKTLRQLAHANPALGPTTGWLLCLALPLALTLAAAVWQVKASPNVPARTFASRILLLTTWLYFALNFAMFGCPWPWSPWTARTPNALAFFICAVALTLAALRPVITGRSGGPCRSALEHGRGLA